MATEVINTYLKNRFQYHAGSRVGIGTHQSFAQATNVDGHTVTNSKIWSSPLSAFPKNTGTNKTSSDGVATTKDLVNVFKSDATSGYINGSAEKGIVWENTNYPAVKLYENALMNGIEYSDGGESGGGKYQSYELKVNGSRVQDWVSPVAVSDDGLPIPGYTGIIEVKKSSGDWTVIQQAEPSSWALAKGTWEFVYGPGMLIFDPSVTPVAKNWPNVRITAFAYSGEYLDTTIQTIQNTLGISDSESTDENLTAKVSRIDSQYLSGITTVGDALTAVKSSNGHDYTITLSADNKTIVMDSNKGLTSKLTIAKLATATSGFAASYQLQDVDGTAIGSTIDIVKDQFLKNVSICEAKNGDVDGAGKTITAGNKCLKFEFFVNENGIDTDDTALKTILIDIEEYFNAFESGPGISVSHTSISGVIDPTSETFLSVGNDGFKLSGVQSAIDTAVSNATSIIDDMVVVGKGDGIKSSAYKIGAEIIANSSAMGTANTLLTEKAFDSYVNSTELANLEKLINDLNI